MAWFCARVPMVSLAWQKALSSGKLLKVMESSRQTVAVTLIP